MARKTLWVGLLGVLTLIVIASGCQPRTRTWAVEYPGPWRSDASTDDFRAIVWTLARENIRGCGEFHYRPSVYHYDQYLVYCTVDAKIWRAYEVWPRRPRVSGPQTPAIDVPPPYRH